MHTDEQKMGKIEAKEAETIKGAINEPNLPKNEESPTAKDMFQPIPGLIRCMRWGDYYWTMNRNY